MQYRRPGTIVKHGQPPTAPSALNSALPKHDFIKMRPSNFLLLFLGLCILGRPFASVCMLNSRGCDYWQIKWDEVIWVFFLHWYSNSVFKAQHAWNTDFALKYNGWPTNVSWLNKERKEKEEERGEREGEADRGIQCVEVGWGQRSGEQCDNPRVHGSTALCVWVWWEPEWQVTAPSCFPELCQG